MKIRASIVIPLWLLHRALGQFWDVADSFKVYLRISAHHWELGLDRAAFHWEVFKREIRGANGHPESIQYAEDLSKGLPIPDDVQEGDGYGWGWEDEITLSIGHLRNLWNNVDRANVEGVCPIAVAIGHDDDGTKIVTAGPVVRERSNKIVWPWEYGYPHGERPSYTFEDEGEVHDKEEELSGPPISDVE